mmetsp:Transcript_29379/g.87112  ORF Transcript_29379/g.87112 Transcript_29379/m.87112 type:complete len:639 (-) Transcript_29379:1255-3171(-)
MVLLEGLGLIDELGIQHVIPRVRRSRTVLVRAVVRLLGFVRRRRHALFLILRAAARLDRRLRSLGGRARGALGMTDCHVVHVQHLHAVFGRGDLRRAGGGPNRAPSGLRLRRRLSLSGRRPRPLDELGPDPAVLVHLAVVELFHGGVVVPYEVLLVEDGSSSSVDLLTVPMSRGRGAVEDEILGPAELVEGVMYELVDGTLEAVKVANVRPRGGDEEGALVGIGAAAEVIPYPGVVGVGGTDVDPLVVVEVVVPGEGDLEGLTTVERLGAFHDAVPRPHGLVSRVVGEAQERPETEYHLALEDVAEEEDAGDTESLDDPAQSGEGELVHLAGGEGRLDPLERLGLPVSTAEGDLPGVVALPPFLLHLGGPFLAVTVSAPHHDAVDQTLEGGVGVDVLGDPLPHLAPDLIAPLAAERRVLEERRLKVGRVSSQHGRHSPRRILDVDGDDLNMIEVDGVDVLRILVLLEGREPVVGGLSILRFDHDGRRALRLGQRGKEARYGPRGTHEHLGHDHTAVRRGRRRDQVETDVTLRIEYAQVMPELPSVIDARLAILEVGAGAVGPREDVDRCDEWGDVTGVHVKGYGDCGAVEEDDRSRLGFFGVRSRLGVVIQRGEAETIPDGREDGAEGGGTPDLFLGG